MQSTKFEFVLNLKTAKTLGLDVPITIQMTADAQRSHRWYALVIKGGA